jgi:hypothetical protein
MRSENDPDSVDKNEGPAALISRKQSQQSLNVKLPKLTMHKVPTEKSQSTFAKNETKKEFKLNTTKTV